MDIFGIRQGLANNAATVGDVAGQPLNVYAGSSDSITEPAFVVAALEIRYNGTFGRGAVEVTVTGRLMVSRIDDESANERLSTYLSSSGSTSLPTALESDRTLDDAAHDVTVLSAIVPEDGIEHAGISYIGAEFTIAVIGAG